MTSTHPRVGMTLLVRVRAKAKVWALARRDAHSFLAVWAVCCIVSLRCCDFFFSFEAGRERRLRRLLRVVEHVRSDLHLLS